MQIQKDVIETILFSNEVVEVIASEIDKHGIIETGGVLLGYQGRNSLVITKATPPGPKAIHEEYYFEADHEYVEMLIDVEYANTNGKVRYQGEWHTHSQIQPKPSPKDIRSLMNIAKGSEFYTVLTIIGAIEYTTESFLQNCCTLIKYRETKGLIIPQLKRI